MKENKNPNPARLSPTETVEQLKIITEVLNKEIQNLNSGISGIDEKLKVTEKLINQSLKELKESVMNIYKEDLKKLESYKDYFKHYKHIMYTSPFVMVSG